MQIMDQQYVVCAPKQSCAPEQPEKGLLQILDLRTHTLHSTKTRETNPKTTQTIYTVITFSFFELKKTQKVSVFNDLRLKYTSILVEKSSTFIIFSVQVEKEYIRANN